MKKQQNNSTHAWALQVALSIALLSISAVLLASSFKTTPVTRGLSAPINPVAAPANTNTPVLVVTTNSNQFSKYYSEILKAEGLNAFQTADIGTVNAAALANYDTVLLGEVSLTPPQVTTFTDWVNAGGNLIAMKPDKQLAGLLGLTDASSTLADKYLLVDTASNPGAGIVNQTIQFHSSADLYSLNGATSIATLYLTQLPPQVILPLQQKLLGQMVDVHPHLHMTWQNLLFIRTRATRRGQHRKETVTQT